MKTKRIVCFCLDVSEDDIIDSIEEGYKDIETLKRYTACTMGPCQGKLCMMNFIKLFLKHTGEPLARMNVPTVRTPIHPVPLGALAAEDPLKSK